MRLAGICVSLIVVLIAGCAKIAAVSGTTAGEQPISGKGAMLPGSDIRASGFLGDYSELKPAPDEKYVWRGVTPGVKWKQYDSVYVVPLEVWLNPEAEHPGIRPEVYSEVDRLFKEIVAKEFGSHGYKLADRPGAGVLVFRGALTGVTPLKQGFEPSDVLPIKAAVNLGKYAFGDEPYYIVLTGEIEMLDGRTGKRVFAAVGARRGFETTTKNSQIGWSELKDTFAWVAERWRLQLDQARAKG
jgi:Protein of unknown function (DUF3313)